MKDSAIMGGAIDWSKEGAKSHQGGEILLLRDSTHCSGNLIFFYIFESCLSYLSSNFKVKMHDRKSIYLLEIGTNWASDSYFVFTKGNV